MKIIIIDNKHYIPARVVMLFNKNEIINPLIILKNDGTLVFYDERFHKIRIAHQEFGNFEIQDASYQHLYLICDLPIEVDDYVIDETGLFGPYESTDTLIEPSKKIVATSDVELKIPQFQQSFIKEFVERQGKDVNVLVEINNRFLGYEDISGMPMFEDVIKLNPDNTVNLIFK